MSYGTTVAVAVLAIICALLLVVDLVRGRRRRGTVGLVLLGIPGIRNGARTLPLRIGGRMATLPYAGAAEEAPKEWALSFGTGFTLAAEQRLPQAEGRPLLGGDR